MYSQHLNYLPLEPALFFILFVGLASLAVLVNLGVFSYAFTRLGLHPGLAVWLLFASLLGSYINIPVAHFPHVTIVVAREFDQFGIRNLHEMRRDR